MGVILFLFPSQWNGNESSVAGRSVDACLNGDVAVSTNVCVCVCVVVSIFSGVYGCSEMGDVCMSFKEGVDLTGVEVAVAGGKSEGSGTSAMSNFFDFGRPPVLTALPPFF